MRWPLIAAAIALIGACGGDAGLPVETAPNMIELPAPNQDGDVSLERALTERRSVRDYTGGTLDLVELSQLFWAVQGITSDQGGRTAPSAGGLYPLETYVVTPDGWFRYVPSDHRLETLGDGDVRHALAEAALGQAAVSTAPAVFVITGVYARTAFRYGERAERYVKLEAGHAAQNLLLQAVAVDLAAVPIGAFDDAEVQSVLRLPADHEPLYLIPVGRAALQATP